VKSGAECLATIGYEVCAVCINVSSGKVLKVAYAEDLNEVLAAVWSDGVRAAMDVVG